MGAWIDADNRAVEDAMIEIPLSKKGKNKGKYVAIIDDIDAPIAEISWCVSIDQRGNVNAQNQYTTLARAVMEKMLGRALHPSETVRTKNKNFLDNRRDNLVLVDSNIKPRKIRKMNKRNKSGFRGVSFFKNTGSWKAYINVNKQHIHLGYYKSEDEAFQARLDAEQQYYGNEGAF